MRTKKKTVEQKKTETARNLQSQSGWVWVSMEEKIFGKDMFLA